MAATVEVRKCTGTDAGTETSVSGIALKSVDDATTSAANAPVQILDSGNNYSYESWIRFKVTNMGGSSQLTNFKIWGSGASVATGVTFTINTDAVDTGVTPVETQSAQGTRADFADHGSGSKIDIAGTLVGINEKTDYAVFQEDVADTASPGAIPQQTCYYSYDES